MFCKQVISPLGNFPVLFIFLLLPPRLPQRRRQQPRRHRHYPQTEHQHKKRKYLPSRRNRIRGPIKYPVKWQVKLLDPRRTAYAVITVTSEKAGTVRKRIDLQVLTDKF